MAEMAWRTKLKRCAIVIVGIAVALQFWRPSLTNPPVNVGQTLEEDVAVPREVSALFARSCNDCHSNTTNWLWYSYVSPVSWFTVDHVNKGRKELNMSEWGQYGERAKDTRLKAICAQCRAGTMPLASYVFMHREAKLSTDEVKMICDWTENARKQPEKTRP
ncbi:MAG TPA: heme-binding domain-containing protein [Pyrinomonadaceae bacterium]|jgi:hypothetical protein